MKVLLDTHMFLWILDGDGRLPQVVRDALNAPTVSVYVSVINAWELAIKSSLGRIELPAPVRTFFPEAAQRYGFEILSVTVTHAATVETLPYHHRDPFDRLLVAQTQVESMCLATVDSAIEAYGVDMLPGGRA